MLFIGKVALLLAAAVCLVASDETGEGLNSKLEELCGSPARSQGKRGFFRTSSSLQQRPLFMTSVKEMGRLLDYYVNTGYKCTQDYDEPIWKLRQLLSSNLMYDVCSFETFELIRQYHLKYIHYFESSITMDELRSKKKMDGGNKPQRNNGLTVLSPIPEALRDFFILFVKRINGQCIEQAHRMLGAKNGILEDAFVQYQNINKNMREILGRDALAISSESKSLSKLRLEDMRLVVFKGGKLNLRVPPEHPELIQIKNLCFRYFMPVYMDVFGPVLEMNSLGYRDQHFTISLQLGALSDDGNFTRWYDVIQVCELLKNIDMGTQPASYGLSSENLHRAVAFAHHMDFDNVESAKREVQQFRDFVKKSVRIRTSKTAIITNDARTFMNRQFNLLKGKWRRLRQGVENFLKTHYGGVLVGTLGTNFILALAVIVILCFTVG